MGIDINNSIGTDIKEFLYTENIRVLSRTNFLSVWHFRVYSLPVFVKRPFKILLRHNEVAFSAFVWL
jgi:hypothetical protein